MHVRTLARTHSARPRQCCLPYINITYIDTNIITITVNTIIFIMIVMNMIIIVVVVGYVGAQVPVRPWGTS